MIFQPDVCLNRHLLSKRYTAGYKELLRKHQIREFLHHEDVHYTTFKDNAELLIAEGMAPYMFEEELEDE